MHAPHPHARASCADSPAHGAQAESAAMARRPHPHRGGAPEWCSRARPATEAELSVLTGTCAKPTEREGCESAAMVRRLHPHRGGARKTRSGTPGCPPRLTLGRGSAAQTVLARANAPPARSARAELASDPRAARSRLPKRNRPTRASPWGGASRKGARRAAPGASIGCLDTPVARNQENNRPCTICSTDSGMASRLQSLENDNRQG